MNIARIEQVLGYTFENVFLLSAALDYHNPYRQRLEFLGDRVLNFIVADELFTRGLDAHGMSKLSDKIVCNANLSELCRVYGLRSGSNGQMADTIEAILGAMYLDSGRNISLVQQSFSELVQHNYWGSFKEMKNVRGNY